MLRSRPDQAKPAHDLPPKKDILLDGEPGNQSGFLEKANDPKVDSKVRIEFSERALLKVDFHGITPGRPRKDLDQGRFASAIRSKQRMDLAWSDRKRKPVQRLNSGIAFRDIPEVDENRLGFFERAARYLVGHLATLSGFRRAPLGLIVL